MTPTGWVNVLLTCTCTYVIDHIYYMIFEWFFYFHRTRKFQRRQSLNRKTKSIDNATEPCILFIISCEWYSLKPNFSCLVQSLTWENLHQMRRHIQPQLDKIEKNCIKWKSEIALKAFISDRLIEKRHLWINSRKDSRHRLTKN